MEGCLKNLVLDIGKRYYFQPENCLSTFQTDIKKPAAPGEQPV
jgi:hypothetical protein